MQAYVNLRLYRQCHTVDELLNITNNPDLTLETLEMFVDKVPIDWDVLDEHQNFNEKWLLNFPEKPWSWSTLHKHPKFEFDWVYVFLNKPWNWTKLSTLATIPLLRQYPIFSWDWEAVTCCSEITTTEMVKNSDLPWEVSNLQFTEIEDDDIEFLRMYKDDIDWVSISESASLDIVRRNMDLPWFFSAINLEKRPITQDDLDFMNQTDEFNEAALSYLTPFELIAQNKHMRWESETLSTNPTVTYDDVQNHPDLPWDLTITPCEPIDRIIRRWVAASLIKRSFKMAISNPEYKMCRDRLDKEFRNMTN
jgi:hypothetical protein